MLHTVKILQKELNFLEETIYVTYQTFGLPMNSNAPIILVNHALTGNSQVTEANGWWKEIVGHAKVIDLNRYCVISINIVGNGFDKDERHLINDIKAWSTWKIASVFWYVLDKLKVKELYAIIGGSIGGAIAWEMSFLRPCNVQHLIPIASSYQASDWIIGLVHVQEQILNLGVDTLPLARQHAMLFYRTPLDLKQKFNIQMEEETGLYKVQSWLNHHGKELEKRFAYYSYRLMNHLLSTIGQTLTINRLNQFARDFKGKISLIAIDSDLFFTAEEQLEQYKILKSLNICIDYQLIKSPHGHDAFLIEHEQLHKILNPSF